MEPVPTKVTWLVRTDHFFIAVATFHFQKELKHRPTKAPPTGQISCTRGNGFDLRSALWNMQNKLNLIWFTWFDWVNNFIHAWETHSQSTIPSSGSLWTISSLLNLDFPLQPSIYLFLFTSDLFIFEFLHTNLLLHLVVHALSQSCHTTDLSVPFFLHCSTSPLFLVWAVIQLFSGPVRQPVELICLLRS